jgi:ribonuclease HI
MATSTKATPGPNFNSAYYLLFTDGGARPYTGALAPRQAAIGAVLETRKLEAVGQVSKVIGAYSHNVAEYPALIEGMRLARRHRVDHLRAFADSELVVDQMNGSMLVTSPDLWPLNIEAQRLKRKFKSYRLSWIPREMNRPADQLVREAFKSLELKS